MKELQTIDSVLSTKTISDWYSYCREAIVVYELEHDEEWSKIGGPNKAVQIDESKFGRHIGNWVLGMIEDVSDDLRIEKCANNEWSANILVPVIKKHVQEGSIIHTNSWIAYECLADNDYWRGLKRVFHMNEFKGNFTEWWIHRWQKKNINHLKNC